MYAGAGAGAGAGADSVSGTPPVLCMMLVCRCVLIVKTPTQRSHLTAVFFTRTIVVRLLPRR
jgi:hypothetical protein